MVMVTVKTEVIAKKPEFCRGCGTRLVAKYWGDGFDMYSGEAINGNQFVTCPKLPNLWGTHEHDSWVLKSEVWVDTYKVKDW